MELDKGNNALQFATNILAPLSIQKDTLLISLSDKPRTGLRSLPAYRGLNSVQQQGVNYDYS